MDSLRELHRAALDGDANAMAVLLDALQDTGRSLDESRLIAVPLQAASLGENGWTSHGDGSGDGSGDGYGYGDGDGSGYGDGDGDGSGSGDGSGDGGTP